MLEKYYNEYSNTSPGIGVMAIKDFDVVYEEYLGLANCEHNIPITAQSVFNIGSVSKQFTGIAVLQLIENNLICENDKVVTFVPEIKHYAEDIKIYHLVHHMSGVPDYNDLLWQKARNNALYSTNAEILILLKSQTELCFLPGSKMEYCNSNFVLLAIIIERATKMPFADYLKKNIFIPSGMKNTLVFDENEPIVPNRVYGYEQNDSGLHCCYIDTLATGCANVFTSIADMKLYDDILYTDKIINSASKRKLTEAGISNDGQILFDYCGCYSYGWMIQEKCGQKTIWHTGGDAGFRSIYVRFYEKKFSVILFCNCNNLKWDATYKLVEDLYYSYNSN